MKATKQYYPVVLFIMLFKVVRPHLSVNEMHLNVWPLKETLTILSIYSSWVTNQCDIMRLYDCYDV